MTKFADHLRDTLLADNHGGWAKIDRDTFERLVGRVAAIADDYFPDHDAYEQMEEDCREIENQLDATESNRAIASVKVQAAQESLKEALGALRI